VGEYTHFLSRPLEQKEMAEAVDAQDDDNSNNRTLITFSVIWVSAVEI
jgi:hypothetical protein